MPTKEELLAHRHSNMDAIANEIGADRVIYQDLGDLEASSMYALEAMPLAHSSVHARDPSEVYSRRV